MVALWIKLGTTLAGDTPLGIRLLGPLSALAGSLLLARAGEDLAPGRNAGLIAAALLNATLLLNAGSVVMTPDTPLLFFWTATLACLARLIRTQNPAWWLAIGAAAGLALDSKYTAALLAPALLAWLLIPAAQNPHRQKTPLPPLRERKGPAAKRWEGEGSAGSVEPGLTAATLPPRIWLTTWQLWAGAALAIALFAPVLAWNAAHHWASFAKQGGRTGSWAPADAIRFLAELLGGQIGLATPLVFCLLCAGAFQASRRLRAPAAGLLAALTLIPAAVFLQHALGDRVQANWPAIVYPGGALAAAIWAPRYWRPAAAAGALISLAVLIQTAFAPLAVPRALDFTLIRLAGWDDLAGAVYVARARQNAVFVAADEYGLASALAFRLHGDVLSAEPRWRFFALPGAENLAGRTGILVRSNRQAGEPNPKIWPGATLIGTAARARHGIAAETYRLYRVTAGAVPAILLPHPPPSAPFLEPG